MNLSGRVAWVTGGNSGIGAATARALVAEGSKVLITAQNDETGKAIEAELGADNALWIKASMTEREELQAAVDSAVEKWGRLDMLFNSAGGGGIPGMFVSDDPEQMEQCREAFLFGLALNTIGSFDASQIAANYIRQNEPDENGERGAITLVASMAADKIWAGFGDAITGQPFSYGYGTSKASILGLSRDLATTLAQFGIRVNTIKPGYIHTPMTAALQGAADLIWPPMQLFPKVGGEPENIATMAIEIFKNPFINRTQMQVDAGVVG